jgi:hypothetical protein
MAPTIKYHNKGISIHNIKTDKIFMLISHAHKIPRDILLTNHFLHFLKQEYPHINNYGNKNNTLYHVAAPS